MKKLIIILIGLFNILFIYGQVESRVFPNKDALGKIPKGRNVKACSSGGYSSSQIDNSYFPSTFPRCFGKGAQIVNTPLSIYMAKF